MASSDSTDDDSLWAKVTAGIVPADRADVLVPQKASKPDKKQLKKKPIKTAAPIATATAKPAIQTKPADLRSFVAKRQERSGIDGSSAKKLTKGHFEIDDRLDLHGMTEARAHRALHQFVSTAIRRGDRTLLVITGKGAQGQGVLRRKVPQWVKEPPLREAVLALSEASPKDGGSGALYLRLRRMRGQP